MGDPCFDLLVVLFRVDYFIITSGFDASDLHEDPGNLGSLIEELHGASSV